jgi:nitrite reductase (NADH) small subunit
VSAVGVVADARERAIVLGAAELPPGSRALVKAFGTNVALFNVAGALYALNNGCPHNGGPLCHGRIGGAPLPSTPHSYVWGLQDRVLACPWHGWEFDLATGEALFDAHIAAVSYDVNIEAGKIVLSRR